MNIILITSSYPPEIRSSSHLMQELAEGLRDRGHRITVATAYPSHNLASENISPHFKKITVENDIEVLRIKTLPPHMSNYIIRGLSQITLPYIFLYKIKKLIKQKIDVIIVYSPPLPLAIVGWKLKMVHGARYILNVQDLFPQNAVDLGILKNRFLIKIFEHIEKNAYRYADRITAHSENNRTFLNEKKGVSEEKLSVIHNWIDVAPYKNVQKTGRFRELFNVNGKFIFLFAGVIGPSQGLDLIIKVAQRLRQTQDIAFLFVGDGVEKERLTKMTESYGLKNVYFKPFVSKEEYPELVKDADVGLVCLSAKNKTPVVPGKILGYMAASVPVLAFLNKESDGHHVIREAGCGYSEVSDDARKAASLMLRMYQEKERLTEYGKNGFGYAAEHFSKKVCVDKLEDLLQ